MRRVSALLVGISMTVSVFAGCSRIDKILYPTKRSYNFEQIEGQIVRDLEKRDNKNLVSYFAIKTRKKYGTSEIIKELGNAEEGLGKVHKFQTKEAGRSGHRGGLGETITTWEIRLDTDQGRYLLFVNWSDGDNSKGEKLIRYTEGITDLTIYTEEFDTIENLEQLYKVDFPVLYPGIKR